MYNDKRDNSTQVKVYKKANGFVYTLPANLSLDQIRDSKLYDSGDKDITDQMKIELKNRYKLIFISILEVKKTSVKFQCLNYFQFRVLYDKKPIYLLYFL